MNFIGDSIRKLRVQREWTQDYLAKKSGTSGSRISDIELGYKEPTAGLVVRIAAALEEPALLLAKCRQCEIRIDGFKEFFPDIDLSTYAELSHVVDQLFKDLGKIDEQLKIVDSMYIGTEEFEKQFTKLRQMMRLFSYAAAGGANIADLTVFLKRGFVKFGK